MADNRITPVDAFLKFFQNAKPYHVKVLEVLETFRLNDDVCVCINDDLSTEITYKNKPLCRLVGFGLEFDDQCGFDALSCCDYFSCVGGYGLIFDNSDLLASYQIINSNRVDGFIEVTGNVSRDLFIQIDDLDDSRIFINGDQTSLIGQDRIITIAPLFTLDIQSNTSNSVMIVGDFTRFVANGNAISIFNSGEYDGQYGVLDISYDEDTNISSVTLFTNGIDFPENTISGIQISSRTKNNGYYIVEQVAFDGVNTVIELSSQTPVKLPLETFHGSIVLRRGLYSGRDLLLYDSLAEETTNIKISESFFDSNNNTTRVYLLSDFDLDPSISYEARLHGYLFNGGFDNAECSGKSPDKLGASFIENILIQVIEEQCFIVSENDDFIVSEQDNTIRPETCALPEICPIALEDDGFYMTEDGDFIVLEDCEDGPPPPVIFILATEDDFALESEMDGIFTIENPDQF